MLFVDENKYVIDDLSTYKNRLCVTKVPFEMDDDTLKNFKEWYGKVENIVTSYKTYDNYRGMFSVERILWMVVDFPISSSLFITESEIYIYFYFLLHILSFKMENEPNKKSQLFYMLLHILIKIPWKIPSSALMTVVLKWIKIWNVYLSSNKGMTK